MPRVTERVEIEQRLDLARCERRVIAVQISFVTATTFNHVDDNRELFPSVSVNSASFWVAVNVEWFSVARRELLRRFEQRRWRAGSQRSD